VTELLAMFGTPAYMAPEAIEFSPNIDGRADVYGFGVLFFEALTGKLPFPGPPGLELLKRILTEPPPR
jgi:serine/threonine protein kinase